MKISQKLTLSFTILAVLILIIFGTTIYYFSSQYRKSEFYNRLQQRVEITERMFLERDRLSTEMSELIQAQFINKLPDETEEVLPLDALVGPAAESKYPAEFMDRLIREEGSHFEMDSIQGVGKVFHLPEGDFGVILTASDHFGIRMLSHLRTIIIVSLAGCILLISVVSYLLSVRALNPITQKIQKANAISANNLYERLAVVNPDDEIGEMAVAFNSLLDRVAAAFEAQRSFINNASHELRNPLTAIIGEAEVTLEKQRSTQEYIEAFQSIEAEANRLNVLVNNLLQLANISYREVSFKQEPIDLVELLTAAIRKLDYLRPHNQVQLINECAPGIRTIVMGNSHLLQTAFINILDNAIKFSFNESVEVYLRTIGKLKASVLVRDKGLGIPPMDIPKVTQPFHRAPNVRNIVGSGIGVPLTLKIVELHKGTLEIRSSLNIGTEVEFVLPLVD